MIKYKIYKRKNEFNEEVESNPDVDININLIDIINSSYLG